MNQDGNNRRGINDCNEKERRTWEDQDLNLIRLPTQPAKNEAMHESVNKQQKLKETLQCNVAYKGIRTRGSSVAIPMGYALEGPGSISGIIKFLSFPRLPD
jgi:hypothetical protein